MQAARPFAGAVALDVSAMEALLRVLGPVRLPDFGETITAENVLERANFYEGRGDPTERVARPDLVGDAARPFFGALSQAVLDQVLRARPDTLPSVIAALAEAAAQKHLLVALDQPSVAAVLARRGWDGRQLAVAGDYLMVVDTNLRSLNMVSPAIERRAAYDVSLQSDLSGLATLTLTYANTLRQYNPRLGPSNDFEDYVRVYVPRGARLVQADGFAGQVAASDDGAHALLAGRLSVPLGETRAVTLQYRLPPSIFAAELGPRYRLVAQKQPGTTDLALDVTLRLPPGARPGPVRVARGAPVAAPSPAAHTDAPSAPAAHFAVRLGQDGIYEVPFDAPALAPAIAAQPSASLDPVALDRTAQAAQLASATAAMRGG
jgi:hypothetical protein